MAKRVIVACGTGIATSTVVADKVTKACKAAGVAIDLVQCKVVEVASYAEGAALIVTTTPVAAKVSVPVIKALPLLTGIGEDTVIEQIISALRD